MKDIILTKTRSIYNYCEPYVIAEIASNHNGDMELAKKLIFEAKQSGADCVKFQSWTKDTIFSRKKYEDNYFLGDDYRNRTDYNLEEIVDAYSVSEDQLLSMKQYSDLIGIDFASTPFSRKEADFLVNDLQVPFIKIASMDLNNYPFLDYIAKKGKPVILSTGMSELYEIDKAIRTIEATGNKQIVLLHCVALYPPKDNQINLNIINTLQQLYPDYPIGFSDHTIGTCIPLASVVKGACIVEKHFTLDKNMEGWDHKVSATPDELKDICENSKRIVAAMGTFSIRSVEGNERRSEFRRSVVLTRKVNKGEIISENDIDYKRPGIGLAPEEGKYIIGRKARFDLNYDHIISMEDLE